MACAVACRRPQPLYRLLRLHSAPIGSKLICKHITVRHSSFHSPKLCIPKTARPISDCRNQTKDEKTKGGGFTNILRISLVCAFGISFYSFFKGKDDHELSPRNFTSFNIRSIEPISSTGAVFALEPSDGLSAIGRSWNRGIWSVEFKQPELQIARAYTPLPPPIAEESPLVDSQSAKDSLWFLLRKEYKGEMSGYLHGLPVGSEIAVRGPKYEWEIPQDGIITDLVFIAGGTGIAPALQASYALLVKYQQDARNYDPSRKMPRIHIIWANRRREDCIGGISPTTKASSKPSKAWYNWLWAKTFSLSANPEIQHESPRSREDDTLRANPIVSYLSNLQKKFPAHFTVDYKVDEEGTFIEAGELQELLLDTAIKIEKQKKIVMVCGPEGFIDAIAGPKRLVRGGREVDNKTIGGILGSSSFWRGIHLKRVIRDRGWEIVRL